MKIKLKLIIVFLLFLALIPFYTCKRKTLEDPLPTGPSSLAKLLTLTASPNTLSAEELTRQTATIRASLIKYTLEPLSNETIVFEICDAQGNKINIGYFEGNESTVSRTTDASGVVTLTYYGPLDTEIQENAFVYIWATVATDGSEAISKSAPIYIIADITGIKFNISASPTILQAGTTRGTSIITTTLSEATGNPLPSLTIYFEICDADGNKINVGYFEGNVQVATAVTNASGVATATYYGPLATELTENTVVSIRATVAQQGETSIYNSASINIIRESIEKTLTVSANPNVLNAGTAHETSTVTATLTTVAGAPVANQTIQFEICDATGNKVNIGYFTGNQSVVAVVTNASGVATTTYSGPLATEITGNTAVYIKATLASTGTEFLSQSAPINIIDDERTLTVSANPNVILAGTTRATSTITATLTTAGGAPLANQTIYFEIYNATQTAKVAIGYFEGNVQVATAVTNASGVATATYYGPLAAEIAGNTTIYIRATVASTGQELLYNSALIYIIDSQ